MTSDNGGSDNDSGEDESFEVFAPDDAQNRGLDQPTYNSQQAHDSAARELARSLLAGAAGLALVMILAATWMMYNAASPERGTELLAFFGSIVSALGTLLGGVIGYYFGKHHPQ